MPSIKLSEAIRIVKPEYVFYKLTPNNSIKNHSTHKIARSISSLYKNIIQCVKQEERKLIKIMGKNIFIPTKISIHPNVKVSYYVYIEKKKIEFYFIVPKQYASILKEKMSDSWSNITIQEVADVPFFDQNATKYQLNYKKEDGLSLTTDRRDNDLLESNLNVVEILEEGDKVGIIYNFLPSSQHGWRHSYRHTIERVRNHRPVDRNKQGLSFIFKYSLSAIDGLINTLSEVIAGKKVSDVVQNENNIIFALIEKLNGVGVRLSNSTIKKGISPVIPTQIVVFSQCTDKMREYNAAISLCQSFDTLHGDNELTYRKLKKNFSITDYSISGEERNKVSDEEAQNFISIAGREILERFNFIEKIETHETQIPEDLQEGVMCIGENMFRGKATKTFLSNDKEYRNLLTLLIGPTRAGKSNLIGHLCIDAIEAGECVIIFDFIENCELSDEIARLFPKDKVLEVRCDDFKLMQGLGFNEVGYSEDVFEHYKNTKDQTSNILALINAINDDESRLSAKMNRYLESASLIVFISGGSIGDIFNVLQNHNTRRSFLNKVPPRQYENLGEYMDSLRELDEIDSKTGEIIGTKLNLIAGIIDRLNILKRNAHMELMLKKDTSKNFDLSHEMQKNQLIVIKMPETMFTTKGEKDVYTLFWLSKLWLASAIRAQRIRDKSKRTKVNIVIDELYQVENTEKLLKEKLSQLAKFVVKPIVSCHYINQLKNMRTELRSANTSYMLISGCDSDNYKELKSELYPFKEEDLLNLPPFYSLNYLKCKGGYAKFITRLPGKVENRVRKGIKQNEDQTNENVN